jgi:transposase
VKVGGSPLSPGSRAIRHDPIIAAFYQRFVMAGRPGMLAVTAAMRKLLVILTAILRDQRPWQPA